MDFEQTPFSYNLQGRPRAPRPIIPGDAPYEESEEEDDSSSDPIDFLGQQQSAADAHIGDAFRTICAEEELTFSLEEAIEFAFDARAAPRLPSEPNQWRDIRGRPDASQWHAAALEEFTALLENGTFEPVRLPAGKKAIDCRWVFKLKRKADGSVDRYKARLVAKGFSQRPGLDFGQVFAPTARWAALRAIFALAALQDLELFSLDISNAFLNGELEHDVYMRTPEGFKDRFGTDFVLKLNRALYGLKQAGHQWHKKLDSVMTAASFKLVRCDNSIWVYQRGSAHLIVPVYVDDMTIACKTRAEYENLVQELKKHFKLKELGPISSLVAFGCSGRKGSFQVPIDTLTAPVCSGRPGSIWPCRCASCEHSLGSWDTFESRAGAQDTGRARFHAEGALCVAFGSSDVSGSGNSSRHHAHCWSPGAFLCQSWPCSLDSS